MFCALISRSIMFTNAIIMTRYAASGAGPDANLKFEVSDFFAMNDETFDVIYDYT